MDFNSKYNDVIKAALKATLHDKQDYIVYIDGDGSYNFFFGERGNIVLPGNDIKLLGWTEFFMYFDFPKANYLEFEQPLTIDQLNLFKGRK